MNIKPLLDLAFSLLFARRYQYNPPSEREIIEALKDCGIENPVMAMEEWRMYSQIHADGEIRP